jgi:hypothetical protein
MIIQHIESELASHKDHSTDAQWVIETNDDTINREDAACGYKSLMVVERCFRSLKRKPDQDVPLGLATNRKTCLLLDRR